MSNKITVFDIEVLNQDPASICAIGIVELKNYQIKSTYYSLIRPKNLSYDMYRYKVHKIRSKTLLKERSFKEVWRDIEHYFHNRIVVSHDIQGDLMHLREALKQYHQPYPHLYMSCTNVLAHLVYPQLKKYKLKEVAALSQFDFQAHHALEDAKACSHILVEMMKYQNVHSIQELHEKFHLEFGEMKDNYYRNIISAEMVPQILNVSYQNSYLFQQSICFTGYLTTPKEVIEERTRQVGAIVSHNVSMQTNYLVIGQIGYYKTRYSKENKKVKKVLSLKKQGQDIHIVHENEYIKLLEKSKQ